MSVLFSTQEAFCQASTVQTFSTSVQPAVAIEKTSSTNIGTIEPATGNITGDLSSSFLLQVNDGNAYDFIIYSSITTADGSVSAFDKNGNLIFANTTILPLNSAVTNAKENLAGNADVIVYPFTISVDTDMTKTYTTSETYNECYKVNFTGETTEGNLTQTIGGTPITNTYSIGEDTAGTYSATVYITAVAK